MTKKTKTVEELFGKGLTANVKLTLGVLQGISTTEYFTAADIAFAILVKEMPLATVADAKVAVNRTSTVLTTMMRSDTKNIERSESKLVTKATFPNGHYIPISAIGYRIAVKNKGPGINADIVTERKESAQFAESISLDPINAVKLAIPKLTDSQLTDVMMDILAIKDERMLSYRNDLANCRREDNKAKSNAKLVLETALAQLTNTEGQ